MPTTRIEKGIARHDFPEHGRKGYYVRITRKGKTRGQYFSDSLYGGKRKALAAARECYADWESRLPKPKTIKDVKTRRNTSGVVGVNQSTTQSEHWSDVSYTVWNASWTNAKGKREKISFSVGKYGKRKAFGLACIAREKKTCNRERILRLWDQRNKKR